VPAVPYWTQKKSCLFLHARPAPQKRAANLVRTRLSALTSPASHWQAGLDLHSGTVRSKLLQVIPASVAVALLLPSALRGPPAISEETTCVYFNC
jgi:hypothetical protein